MQNGKVRVCIATYLNDSQKRVDSLFACVYSILCQTYQNFEIYIHHDGPLNDKELPEKFTSISEKIKFIDNLEKKGSWGAYHRRGVSLMDPHPEWVLYTNDDNYYVPVFLERMIGKAVENNSKMVFCDCLHNYFGYTVLNTKVKVCHIDMGSFITHIDLIKATTWTDFGPLGDGVYAKRVAAQTIPVKADGVLFVHN